MADSVSKLYAEIGFKINQDGLKQAQELLKSLAAQMTAINNATKNAAREYGIFSKDKAKQALADEKLATQKAKTERELNKKSLDDKNFYYKQARSFYKLDADEKRRINKEKESEDRKAIREEEKSLKQREKIYNRYSAGIRKLGSFAKGLLKYGVGGSLGDAMANALSSSIPMRDMLMQTGLDFQQVQGVARRFSNIGSSMSYEGIMGDLRNLQQNLVNISLGQGELAPYKLLGVAAGKGDLFGTIRELGNAIKDLDNPMALNLIRRTGLSDEWLSYFRFQERKGGISTSLSDESLGQLVESQTAIRQLQFAFQETAKHLTAALNPAITSTTDALTQAFEGVISAFNSQRIEINKAFKELGNSLVELVKGIKWDEFPKLVKSTINGFVEAMQKFKGIIDWVADKLGISTEKEETQSSESDIISEKRVFGKLLWRIKRKGTVDGSSVQPSPYDTNGAIYNSLLKSTGGDVFKSLTFSPVINNNVSTTPENTEAVARGLNESSLQYNPFSEKVNSENVVAAYLATAAGSDSIR